MRGSWQRKPVPPSQNMYDVGVATCSYAGNNGTKTMFLPNSRAPCPRTIARPLVFSGFVRVRCPDHLIAKLNAQCHSAAFAGAESLPFQGLMQMRGRVPATFPDGRRPVAELYHYTTANVMLWQNGILNLVVSFPIVCCPTFLGQSPVDWLLAAIPQAANAARIVKDMAKTVHD